MVALPPTRAAAERAPPSRFRLLPGPARGRITLPGSKSYTHRALLAGSLGTRPLRVKAPQVSEDTLASVRAVEALGGWIEEERQEGSSIEVWEVHPPEAGKGEGPSGSDPRPLVEVDVGESGTTLRLFSAAVAGQAREVRFVGAPALARRPMEGLLRALESMGAHVTRPPQGGSLPLSVRGPLRPGKVRVPGDVSSQFISGLLFVLPSLDGDSDLQIEGPTVSEPYLEVTVATLASQGVRVERVPSGFHVPGGQRFSGSTFQVPGDASVAANFCALAAITGGPIALGPLPPGASWPQADLALIDLLPRLGARVERRGGEVVEVSREGALQGPGRVTSLPTFDIDLDASPDLGPLLSVLAAFGRGRSQLRGGAHLRGKESDRRDGMVRLARALGARAEDQGDTMWIEGPARAKRLELLDLTDHRMLFAASIAAAALPEPSLLGDGRSTAKSHPAFLSDLASLGIGIESAEPSPTSGREGLR